MPNATDQQMQDFADNKFRVRVEQMRNLYQLMKNDKAEIQDIYDRCINDPTWEDSNALAPHAMTCDNMLAINTAYDKYIKLVEGTIVDKADADQFAAQWPIVTLCCIRSDGSQPG